MVCGKIFETILPSHKGRYVTKWTNYNCQLQLALSLFSTSNTTEISLYYCPIKEEKKIRIYFLQQGIGRKWHKIFKTTIMHSVLTSPLKPVQIMGFSDVDEEVKDLNILNAFKFTYCGIKTILRILSSDCHIWRNNFFLKVLFSSSLPIRFSILQSPFYLLNFSQQITGICLLYIFPKRKLHESSGQSVWKTLYWKSNISLYSLGAFSSSRSKWS